MRFDAVIANPPYDRTDIQMKFAMMAFGIANKLNCLIIPAKWQCKADKTKEKVYSTFRKEIVPHMKEICFFSNSVDVFNIGDPGGISYYIADKSNTYPVKTIENRCRPNKYYNDKVTRPFEGNLNSLNNKGQAIIDKIQASGGFTPYKVSEHIDRNGIQYWCGEVPHIAGGGGVNTGSILFNMNTGKLQVLAVGEVYSPFQLERGATHSHYNCLFSSKSLYEVLSFISYAYSKFVRFLIFNSMAGMSSTGNDVWWRFVPDQFKFDHIFTDDELYNKYNLTSDEIEIIENTVEERSLEYIVKHCTNGLKIAAAYNIVENWTLEEILEWAAKVYANGKEI